MTCLCFQMDSGVLASQSQAFGIHDAFTWQIQGVRPVPVRPIPMTSANARAQNGEHLTQY